MDRCPGATPTPILKEDPHLFFPSTNAKRTVIQSHCQRMAQCGKLGSSNILEIPDKSNSSSTLVCVSPLRDEIEESKEKKEEMEDLTFDEDSISESLLLIDTTSESEDNADSSHQTLSNAQNGSADAMTVLKFSCKQCGERFPWAYQLRQHRRLVHGAFKCNICSKYLGSEGSMKHHKKSKHNVNYVFSCQLCNEAFIKARDLIQHQRIHRSIEKRRCFKCKKKFQTEMEIQKQRCGRCKKRWQLRSKGNNLWGKRFEEGRAHVIKKIVEE